MFNSALLLNSSVFVDGAAYIGAQQYGSRPMTRYPEAPAVINES